MTTQQDDICSQLPDGLNPDPESKDCISYIKCSNGRIESKESCPQLTIFNGVLCVPSFLYQCPQQISQIDFCRSRKDGPYIDPRKGCNHYVRCTNGKTTDSQSCDSGYYFDPDQKSCQDQNKQPEMCHEIGFSNDCSEKSAGYFQDLSQGSNCKTYYYCYNGKRTNFKCPEGKLFDGDSCVDESSYKCPNMDPDSCATKVNGYYKDSKAGCRSYYFCSNGNKISYLCGFDQAFDGEQCVEKHKVTDCELDMDCHNKPDGYYQDISSNCRNYFFCLRGEKAQTLTCRASRVFDGTGCVSPEIYRCPKDVNDTSTNCIPRSCEKECSQQGFFPNLDDNCRSYYFCIEGVKTSLHCSNNFIFNGEICVPEVMFNCPRYCEEPKCSS